MAGKPSTLLESLSLTSDRRQQLGAVHAYWRLVAALAEHRIAFDENAMLQRVDAKPADAAMLRAAQASSAAAMRAAESAAIGAQYDLAEASALPAVALLPIPSDRPHVGPYRTYFDELFGARPAPGRTRLIHRTLPVRQQVIEAGVSSVLAAQDAVEATLEAYRAGQADWSALLPSLRQWAGQRRLLIRSVCDYNHDIAEYVFAVASPQASSQVLVSMLIKSAAKPAAPKSGFFQPTPGSGVQPTAFNEPASVSRARAAGVPTLAPPENVVPSGSPDPSTTPQPSPSSTGDPSASAQPRSILAPAGAPTPAPAPTPGSTQPTTPLPSNPQGASLRTTNRLIQNAGPAPAGTALYAALGDLSAAVRAQQLAVALHRSGESSIQGAEPIELARCLQGVPVADRRAAIDAYWLACQRATECRVLADQVGLLEELRSAALAQRSDPGGPAAMLRLQAAVVSVGTEQIVMRVNLLDAQFELTRRAARSEQGPWLLPTTAPHSGPYVLNRDASRPAPAESWLARRAAAAVPARLIELQERATAVVQADAARAATAKDYAARRGTLDPALAASRQQVEETLAFLAVQTTYNRTIAEYALSVVPSTLPVDQLVRTLVVVK